MAEYICKEVKTDNGGYLEIKKELVRCRECKHYSPFTDEFVSWCPIIGHKGLPEDAYCFRAERKEE